MKLSLENFWRRDNSLGQRKSYGVLFENQTGDWYQQMPTATEALMGNMRTIRTCIVHCCFVVSPIVSPVCLYDVRLYILVLLSYVLLYDVFLFPVFIVRRLQ